MLVAVQQAAALKARARLSLRRSPAAASLIKADVHHLGLESQRLDAGLNGLVRKGRRCDAPERDVPVFGRRRGQPIIGRDAQTGDLTCVARDLAKALPRVAAYKADGCAGEEDVLGGGGGHHAIHGCLTRSERMQ